MKQAIIKTLFIILILFILIFAVFGGTLFGKDKVGTCLEAEEYTSFYTSVLAKPASLSFKYNYGLCYSGRRTCTGAKYQNPDYRTNGENIIVRITGAWSGWKFAKKKDVCTMVEREDPNSELSTEEVPYRINAGPTEGNPDNVGFLDENEDYLPVEKQEVCWYNSGEGLYMGFFDYFQGEETDKLYHMYTPEVQCPVQYRNNSDNIDWRDRIIGDCEECACVERKCEDTNKNNKYEDSECVYYNRAIAIFNFEQMHGKGIIEPNKYVKFKVLDRYHLDNQGSYTLEFTKGIGQIETSIISSLINTVENTILGEVGPDGSREGGFIKQFYNNVVTNNIFIDILRTCLVFYVFLLGFGIITGRAELTTHELMRRGLTVSIILLFSLPGSWEYFEMYVINFFVNLAKLNLFGASSNAIALLDSKVVEFFTSDYIHTKILSLIFSPLAVLGFVLVVLFYAFLALFAVTIVKVLYTYLFSFIQLAITFIMFPFVIVLFLFEFTKDTFMNWLSLATAKAMEMMMVLLATNILIEFIVQNFSKIVWLYDVCYEELTILFIDGASPYIKNGDLGWMQLFGEMFVLIATSMLYLGALFLILDVIVQIGNRIGAISMSASDVSKAGGAAGAEAIGAATIGGLFSMAKGFAGGVRGLSVVRDAGKLLGRGLSDTRRAISSAAGSGVEFLAGKSSVVSGLVNTVNKVGDRLNFARRLDFNSSVLAAKKSISKTVKSIAEKDGIVREEMLSRNPSVREMVTENFANLQRERSEGLYEKFESLMNKNMPAVERYVDEMFDQNINDTFRGIYKKVHADLAGRNKVSEYEYDREFFEAFARHTKRFLEEDGMSFDGVRTYNVKELQEHIEARGGLRGYLSRATESEAGVGNDFVPRLSREVAGILYPSACELLNCDNVSVIREKLNKGLVRLEELEELHKKGKLTKEEFEKEKEEITRSFVGETKIEVGQNPFEMMKTDIEIMLENELIAGLKLGGDNQSNEGGEAEKIRKEMRKKFTEAQVKMAKIDLKMAESLKDIDPVELANLRNRVDSLQSELNSLPN